MNYNSSGSLASSVFDPYTPLVGASGGVYALLTAQLANVILVSAPAEKYAVIFFYNLLKGVLLDCEISIVFQNSDVMHRISSISRTVVVVLTRKLTRPLFRIL